MCVQVSIQRNTFNHSHQIYEHPVFFLVISLQFQNWLAMKKKWSFLMRMLKKVYVQFGATTLSTLESNKRIW